MCSVLPGRLGYDMRIMGMIKVMLMYIRIFVMQIVIDRAVSGASIDKKERKQLSLSFSFINRSYSFPLSHKKKRRGGEEEGQASNIDVLSPAIISD